MSPPHDRPTCQSHREQRWEKPLRARSRFAGESRILTRLTSTRARPDRTAGNATSADIYLAPAHTPMASAASTSAAVAAVASRLLTRRPTHLLRRLPRAPPAVLSARPSSSSSSFGAAPLRRPLGHRARMGHTSAAASAVPALGLTKPNVVEPPQVRVPFFLCVRESWIETLAW